MVPRRCRILRNVAEFVIPFIDNTMCRLQYGSELVSNVYISICHEVCSEKVIALYHKGYRYRKYIDNGQNRSITHLYDLHQMLNGEDAKDGNYRATPRGSNYGYSNDRKTIGRAIRSTGRTDA